jgi:hypothetical protein
MIGNSRCSMTSASKTMFPTIIYCAKSPGAPLRRIIVPGASRM